MEFEFISCVQLTDRGFESIVVSTSSFIPFITIVSEHLPVVTQLTSAMCDLLFPHPLFRGKWQWSGIFLICTCCLIFILEYIYVMMVLGHQLSWIFLSDDKWLSDGGSYLLYRSLKLLFYVINKIVCYSCEHSWSKNPEENYPFMVLPVILQWTITKIFETSWSMEHMNEFEWAQICL